MLSTKPPVMENTPASPLPRPASPGRPPQSPRAILAHALLLAGAAGAVLLAGGAAQGSLGVFLVCAGLALLLCPPQTAVPGRLWLAGAALLACCAASFLPVRLLPVPAWRTALATVPAIPLPSTITPVPRETAFWLALVTISLLTGLFARSQPVRSLHLLSLALGAVLVCALYSALSMLASLTGWHYPWTGEGATFGFFANRNNTATFLITGSVLAVGTLGVSFRDRRWISVDLAVVALVLCVPGLFFFSASRAGVIVLFLGIGLWLGGLGGRHRPRQVVLTVGAVVLLGLTGFLVIRSTARDRILDTVGIRPGSGAAKATPPPTSGQPASSEVSSDFRFKIYQDALDMVRDYPLTGTGLGTFPLVFPQYRRASLSEAPAIHPESDWLMAAAECGLPAVLCLGALIGCALGALRPLRAHPYWPLRWGCVAAALAAVIHGLFDAPAHHVALGWWTLVLAGLGLQIPLPEHAALPGRGPRWQHAVFVLAGLGALGLGGRLVGAQWFGAGPLPPFYAAAMQPKIFDTLSRPGGAERAMDMAQETIRRAPLYDSTYFLLTEALGQFEGVRNLMDDNCRAQRLINPIPPGIPLEQGDLWVDIDPPRAAAFWLDAVARDQRIAEATGGWVSRQDSYGGVVQRAGNRPELLRLLWNETGRGTTYVFIWLEVVPVEICRAQIGVLAGDEGFLSRLNPAERTRFLHDWETRGDPEALGRFRASHPGW